MTMGEWLIQPFSRYGYLSHVAWINQISVFNEAFWYIHSSSQPVETFKNQRSSPSIYSIMVRNTSIIHNSNYSSLQVMRPAYYWRHGSYTSDWAFYTKNPCAKKLFIPLLAEINNGNSPFLEENSLNIQKLTSKNLSKWLLFSEWC